VVANAVVFTFRLVSRRSREEQALPAAGQGQLVLEGVCLCFRLELDETAEIQLHGFEAYRLYATKRLVLDLSLRQVAKAKPDCLWLSPSYASSVICSALVQWPAGTSALWPSAASRTNLVAPRQLVSWRVGRPLSQRPERNHGSPAVRLPFDVDTRMSRR
jgi:hypothetical protein